VCLQRLVHRLLRRLLRRWLRIVTAFCLCCGYVVAASRQRRDSVAVSRPTTLSAVLLPKTRDIAWEDVFSRVTHGHAPPTKESLAASVEEGTEFFARGITFAGADVLDVGCGNGRQLVGLLDQGINSYVGLDPVRESIDFCERELVSRISDCRFVFFDVYNEYYNPTGSMQPENATLPFPDASFDSVLTGSVFTHLGTIDVSTQYINEIARILKPQGKFFSSWFRNPPNQLSDDRQRSVYPEGEILNALTDHFHVYNSRGGFMGEFHDQWCLFSTKK
jgi:SAM-dependent methyltransferase